MAVLALVVAFGIFSNADALKSQKGNCPPSDFAMAGRAPPQFIHQQFYTHMMMPVKTNHGMFKCKSFKMRQIREEKFFGAWRHQMDHVFVNAKGKMQTLYTCVAADWVKSHFRSQMCNTVPGHDLHEDLWIYAWKRDEDGHGWMLTGGGKPTDEGQNGLCHPSSENLEDMGFAIHSTRRTMEPEVLQEILQAARTKGLDTSVLKHVDQSTASCEGTDTVLLKIAKEDSCPPNDFAPAHHAPPAFMYRQFYTHYQMRSADNKHMYKCRSFKMRKVDEGTYLHPWTHQIDHRFVNEHGKEEFLYTCTKPDWVKSQFVNQKCNTKPGSGTAEHMWIYAFEKDNLVEGWMLTGGGLPTVKGEVEGCHPPNRGHHRDHGMAIHSTRQELSAEELDSIFKRAAKLGLDTTVLEKVDHSNETCDR
jgi:hypothetical protein